MPPRYALIGNRVKILRAAGNSVYPYIRQGGPTNNDSLGTGSWAIHWMSEILSDHLLVLTVIPASAEPHIMTMPARAHDSTSPPFASVDLFEL